MMSNSDNDSSKTLLLGKEYDDDLRENLLHALKELNASIHKKNHYVSGSQDLEIVEFIIDNEIIVMESETFIGLPISGSSKILRKILLKLNNKNN